MKHTKNIIGRTGTAILLETGKSMHGNGFGIGNVDSENSSINQTLKLLSFVNENKLAGYRW
jgi:hypothetical protein